MNLTVDSGSPTPPFEQIREQLAGAVLAGVLEAGDRLPPIRQLAADLGLAAGTVARAYAELEAAQLVVTARGRGTRVADRPGAADAVQSAADQYIEASRQDGLDLAGMLALLRARHG